MKTAVGVHDTVRIGVDVGGTKCLGVALVGDKVAAELREPTPSGMDVVETITGVMRSLANGFADQKVSYGLGIAGLVDRNGTLRKSPHVSLPVGTSIASELKTRLGVPVAVDNDATTAAYGEFLMGAGRGSKDMVCITLGTGIGMGVVSNGEAVRGAHGYAGEIGHMPLYTSVGADDLHASDTHQRICPCGKTGCWELKASGTALSAMLEQRADKESASVVYAEYADSVARGLSVIVLALDPQRIVIGGGVSRSLHEFLPHLQTALAKYVYAADARELPEIVGAQLGERAGAIGAALLAV